MDKTAVLEQIGDLGNLKARVINGDFRVKHSQAEGTFSIKPSPHGKPLMVLPSGVESVLRFAGIGDKLSGRLSSSTLAGVVEESLKGMKDGAFSALTDNGNIIDLAPARDYRTVDSERVLDNIARGIKDDVEFNRVLKLPNHTVQVQTLGVEERAVAVDDIVRAGTLTQWSPIGVTAPLVQAFDVRLVCTNGMTHMDVLEEFAFVGSGGGGEGDNIWQWFRQASRRAYQAIGPVTERYQQLMAEEVTAEDRAAVINALLKSMRANKEVTDAVNARALEAPPTNSWEVLNLGTWATTHAMVEPAHILRGQRALTEYVNEDTHSRTCPTCNTPALN